VADGEPFDVPIVQVPYEEVVKSGHVVVSSMTPLASARVGGGGEEGRSQARHLVGGRRQTHAAFGEKRGVSQSRPRACRWDHVRSQPLSLAKICSTYPSVGSFVGMLFHNSEHSPHTRPVIQ
jgi:hypothetical protein